jgi:hypothetical protein
MNLSMATAFVVRRVQRDTAAAVRSQHRSKLQSRKNSATSVFCLLSRSDALLIWSMASFLVSPRHYAAINKLVSGEAAFSIEVHALPTVFTGSQNMTH